VLGVAQRATPLEALKAVTAWAAYQNFEEDQKGTLEPGKLADLVVLSANPLTVPPDTLKTCTSWRPSRAAAPSISATLNWIRRRRGASPPTTAPKHLLLRRHQAL
jgi:dihydroorotase-like cyclic amidohydrolase